MRCDFTLILVCTLMIWCRAEPLPEAVKGNAFTLFRQRVSAKLLGTDAKHQRDRDGDGDGEMIAEHRKADSAEEQADVVAKSRAAAADSASGRLFSKKFLNFDNLFGNKQTPQTPIIIITGGGSETTSPTVTTTSSGTVPSATGTVTTEPEDNAPTGPDDGAPTNRASNDDDGDDSDDSDDDDGYAEDSNADFDEDTAAMQTAALQSALAQEYGAAADKAKVNGTPAKPFRINLKRKGASRGQTIVVRIPLKYKDLFQGGQKVVLSNKGGGGKRKRGNKKRGNKNQKTGKKNKNKKQKQNKRTRFVEA